MNPFVMKYELVTLVDESDTEIGIEEKNKAHKEGLLHRAISVFVFNDKDEMLIQKRAAHKYHSGGEWSNACCSHPLPGENYINAAHRRIVEEMGFDLKLERVKKIIYEARLPNGMIEHELDCLFVGRHSGVVKPNPNEVSEYTYVSIKDLQLDMSHNPCDYTAWFKILLRKEHLDDILRTLDSKSQL